ncbi:MAG TPA: hypothetical protein VFG30_02640 [Polyangiales bacterium]|nr:hypothetical protein [Polyangiales bacterium]
MTGQSGTSAGTAGASGAAGSSTTAGSGLAGTGSVATAGTAGTPRAGAGASAVAGSTSTGTTAGGAGASGMAATSGSGAPAAGSGGTSAAAGAGGTSAAGTGAAGSTSTGSWPAVTDFGKNGPFMPMTKNNDGPGGGYTLFYPQDLGRDGLKHPFITWGNGATTTPPLFTLLPLLASQGFVVIASNNSFVTSAQMKSGLDWLEMENTRMGSPFYQKLDATKVASMGYSLGSLGTFEIANDPRITTTVHISGGAMDKAVVPNLKKPAAFFCGDDSDIAHANCETDFQMANVPVFYGVFPGDHLGILGTYANQINPAAAAWLRWRLMSDASLASWFVGPACTLCKDSKWVVKQKMLDTAPP